MGGATSLLTDIVGSTEKAVELGDGGWAELLESHHSIVRARLSRFHGQEVDTSGDGFFAIFPDPAQAIDAARSIQADLHGLDLRARAGIHLGDCWVTDGKCTGLAIHIGARIAALARADEILVFRSSEGRGWIELPLHRPRRDGPKRSPRPVASQRRHGASERSRLSSWLK